MSAPTHITLSITPSGHLVCVEDPDGSTGLDPAIGKRLAAAFDRSEGHGLLFLATRTVGQLLPAAPAFFRELGLLFMVRLCAAPDLEERCKEVEVSPQPAQLETLLESVPPMTGGELIDLSALERLWLSLLATCREELAAHSGPASEWLHQQNPLFNVVGRVHFHLAERQGDEARPFAFLATYTARVGAGARPQHLPLGRALQEYSGAGDRPALLSLLQPVQRASRHSACLKALVDSGQVFHPLAWDPGQAHRFLSDLPHFESAGIVVKVPDWWKARKPPRPQVRVTVGSKAPGVGLGLDTLLDFRVDVALGGESLSPEELGELLASAGGLVKLRGQWVELDGRQLEEVLAHWKQAGKAYRQGISFLEAMRLLAGEAGTAGTAAEGDAGPSVRWEDRVAGPWLEEALSRLRAPARDGISLTRKELAADLRPYQTAGLAWLLHLNRLALGGCLADDMGLGKTVQVLALLALLARSRPAAPHLLVVPASLISNWESESRRFTPALSILIAHPSSASFRAAALDAAAAGEHDVVITSYGYLSRLEWARERQWDTVVLDEAQAIKNPGAIQTRTVKSLKSRVRLVLTGTPIENRLGDLWSLFDFVNPGLLGSAKAFTQRTRTLAAAGPGGYAPLRRLVRPYILRRMKTDPAVISDLPEKTELVAHCVLSRSQAALYQQTVEELEDRLAALEGMKRRGVVLAVLTRLKQICNHPSHWTGDGQFASADSGKFERLAELCEPLAARQEKVLVFTQYREMTAPLTAYLANLFGRVGLELHGQTPIAKRRSIVARFQEDETVPFLVLSLKAGGTGLNLTAATHVIHFDRWWNPAVEDQATDRAYRIGQHHPVMVHKFVCRGTVEERIDELIRSKRELSAEMLSAGGEAVLTELSDRELLQMVRLDIHSALGDT